MALAGAAAVAAVLAAGAAAPAAETAAPPSGATRPGQERGAAPNTASQEAAPPADDRPLDARTYAGGIEAIRQGRRDEAYKTLRKVFQEFPNSPYAPPALLKVAELIYPAGSLDQIGAASPPVIKEATELLTRLEENYGGSREAPRALVKLGYLALEPANPAIDLDAACARFATAARVYPDSDAADDAYFGSGVCEALRGRDARAADVFARLLDENPASPLAAEALHRFGLALSHLDDPTEAMLALQQVRTRFPDSRFAPRALDRITLLHRLRLQPALAAARPGQAGGPQAGEAVYRVDPAYGAAPPARNRAARAAPAAAAPTFGAVSDIAIDPQGLAVVAAPKSGGVFRLDARGRVQDRVAHPEPEFVGAGEGLAVYISGRGQIAVNARNWSGADLKGADGRPPRSFGPVAVDASGRVHLLDLRENALLIYDPSRRLVGTVRPGGKDGRFLDVAAGADGGVYVLEGRSNAVVVLHQGKEVRRVGLAGLGVTEPVALAADGLGDLFLLDGKTGWVYVGDPEGRRIAVIRTPRDVVGRLGDVTSVAVDATGRVYLGGRRGGALVRFQ
jgi:TolA-binding protein